MKICSDDEDNDDDDDDANNVLYRGYDVHREAFYYVVKSAKARRDVGQVDATLYLNLRCHRCRCIPCKKPKEVVLIRPKGHLWARVPGFMQLNTCFSL